MVKIKKFCCLILTLVTISFSLSLVACSKSEVDRVSKGLTSYEINAYLSEDMTISGTEKVIYYNKNECDLDNICFHLYPRAFRKDATVKPYSSLTLASCFPNGQSYGDILIESVSLNGNQANWQLIGEDEDILQINFDFALQNKKSVEVLVNFNVTIPNCTHRFGYYNDKINLGNWYPIVCVFSDGEFDMSPYYATGDPFYSDIANYFVTITYPEDYLISSTGTSDISSTETGLNAKINAKAVRDFALNFSKNSVAVCENVNGVNVSYVGYSGDDDINECLSLSTKALDYFSKTFGKYPYSSLSVVKTPFIYGGMEYPNIVFISDAIDDDDEFKKVIVHEIAHQWWYGVVGNNEIKDAWLDESLAEYSTALFFENNKEFGINYSDLISNAISSYSLYVDVIKTIRDSVNTKMNLAVNEYQNDYEYSYMIYVKGVIMFDELKNAVGESRLISGLKKYYSDNKFKNATKESFYTAFKSACHKDLDTFFDGYLDGTTIITNIS